MLLPGFRATSAFAAAWAALAILLLLALSASTASAAERVIPGKPAGKHVAFPLRGIEASSVTRARVITGSRSTPLTVQRVRRAVRRGMLLVKRSWPAQRGAYAYAAARKTTSSRLVVTSADSSNPFYGTKFYLDPNSNARRQAEEWRATRPEDAAMMDKIASQPQADWFGSWNKDIELDVDTRVSAITSAGALPVLVAYNIPLRDCGSYSAGGASSADAYRSWIRSFSAGIGTRKAVVILEPDALAQLNCLTSEDRSTRIELLKDAISVLGAQPATSVYVDAGNSAWVPASEMASRLQSVGIEKARGFAVNVSNFRWNSESAAYGRDVSARINSKPFVIDTSRNGLGPTSDNQWCNPDGRALGSKPVSAPETGVDAFFWVKRPGQSDGTCNNGPVAGTWWPEYALGLAQRAAW